ncbi:MAG: tetratricopeptide repeat protein, partial [Elusimicrobia bacterium]|nr:tetratricopeptide repeat protein [Elusimicrobiota bacterium]
QIPPMQPGQQQTSLQGTEGSGLDGGELPSENLPSDVISAPPSAPGVLEQPSTYDKLLESQSLLSQGKPAEAAAAARRAIELQPRNQRAFDAWAEATRELRNYDQLLVISDRGLQAFPKDVDLIKNKVFALNKKKDYAAAISAADQGLGLYSTDATLLSLKAYAQERNGDREGMIKTLETVFALDPTFEPLLLDARASKDGEPFLMPGDSKEAPRKAVPARGERRPVAGLLIFGGLIFLLVLLGVLAVLGVFKHSEPAAAAEPGPEPPAEPPASPPAAG